jgi:hypothetical protein
MPKTKHKWLIHHARYMIEHYGGQPHLVGKVLLSIHHARISFQVYVIDYGLAKKYRDLQTHRHIPYRLVLFSLFQEGEIFSLAKHWGIIKPYIVVILCIGKTRTLQAQHAMQVSTLILESVSNTLCWFTPFLVRNIQLEMNYYYHMIRIECVFYILIVRDCVGRTKPKGWSGISWLCAHVFLKRKVSYLVNASTLTPAWSYHVITTL